MAARLCSLEPCLPARALRVSKPFATRALSGTGTSRARRCAAAWSMP